VPTRALPANTGFLPKAYDEYQSLKARDPVAFDAVHGSLISLGKNGAPRNTRLFRSDEPDFPHGLAYWFSAGGHTIVFEPKSRVILPSETGLRTVRSVLIGGKESLYTVWLIIPNP
jgi:hypothetical protein